MNNFTENIEAINNKAFAYAQQYFTRINDIATKNTVKILDVFRKYQVSDYLFRTTTGYGYSDIGRDRLDEIWAELFGAEKAIVRTHFVSGTHALATALFGVLRPGDELLSLTGAPYDTMQTVIGYKQHVPGSLAEFGIKYSELAMTADGVDIKNIENQLKPNTKLVLIQRSRGYSLRKPLTIAQIQEICSIVKQHKPDCICFVDNCYGEFVDVLEPTAVGADLIAGSLIKNPGGGLAPSGGYIAGRKDLVEQASYRLTAPGIGSELGASLTDNRLLYQGLFLAPHIVGQALQGAVFAAALFEQLGFKTYPHSYEPRNDIIQAIELQTPEKMVAFCQGIQKYSPVDAHVRPEPSGVPGYSDSIIMAAGTFVQGSSIELSADGPIRPPYAVYLQGGLTFEHTRVALLGAIAELTKVNSN